MDDLELLMSLVKRKLRVILTLAKNCSDLCLLFFQSRISVDQKKFSVQIILMLYITLHHQEKTKRIVLRLINTK